MTIIRTNKRVAENEIAYPTMTLLVAAGGFLTTSELIVALEGMFNPKGLDKAILEHRNDSRFSQKVRNLVSHRGASTSIIHNGYVTYEQEENGLRITRKGRDFIRRRMKAQLKVAA